MGLTDRLRDLDQRVLPGTRDDDEDAEAYLRRVAASRAISPAQAGDVMAALRVYFDVEPATGEGDDKDDGEDEESAEEPKDEAADEQADESENASDESESDSEKKSDDED